MRPLHRHLAALAAGAALLAGAGCGSEEEEPGPGIPRESAEQLRRELDLVQKRIDVTRTEGKIGSCKDIDTKSYRDIGLAIEGLPEDTDPDVRQALERSIERLKELTGAECEELAREIGDRQEQRTPEPAPEPAPVQPQETTPEPTETQEQPAEEKKKKKKEEERPKKDEGNGGDGEGGIGPDGQRPPGQDGGGQPAPAPEDE